MENKRVLSGEELEQVNGGIDFDYSKFSEIPKFFCHTSDNFIDIAPSMTVQRISDGEQFVCLGYYNNGNASTTYVFAQVSNPSNTIMFVADANNQTLTEFRS